MNEEDLKWVREMADGPEDIEPRNTMQLSLLALLVLELHETNERLEKIRYQIAQPRF